MKICYTPKSFRDESVRLIKLANEIVEQYQQQGFELTLRQLYYQFVSRGLLPNTEKNYTKLGNTISDARLGGMVDWDAITDRTRFVRKNTHWSSPADIIRACANQFDMDRRLNQAFYVEVWIEKDALVGVIEEPCRRWDVPFFSCRGYVSQSEMWVAAQRIIQYWNNHPGLSDAVIVHLGDHDPSGIDMTRDIEDRLRLFIGYHEEGLLQRFRVQRIALTMEQVERYNPPPNPAKTTDSRYEQYIEKYGHESWELDALDPATIQELVDSKLKGMTNPQQFAFQTKLVMDGREKLKEIADTL